MLFNSFTVEKWCEMIGLEKFNLFKFLSKEQELMKWHSEGLPADKHSVENAIIILMVIIFVGFFLSIGLYLNIVFTN